MSENLDYIQLPPMKRDTPTEVVSMIWEYLKLPKESRERVKAELIDVHENCGKSDFKIPDDELMKKNGLYHKLFHIQQESLGWAV